ncbi:MAG: PfkB family carbohydrate kinase [Chloroflexota bacterium]|nr:PfkB family carbohydrate kinase [Chloroflexota bacterium]
MDERRLEEILDGFDQIKVLVVGDFFLDKYMIIERALSEISLETGLEAYQVVQVQCSPGAAGTVTSNLRALDVDTTALGVIGDDGEGYELKRGLTQRGVHVEPLIERDDLFTPTYTKPMIREEDGREHEINRLDIKNRSPLPPSVEEQVVERLRSYAPQIDGMIIADQVQERNCGVITDRVRDEIARLARQHPQVIFAADSRAHIGLFREVIIKPNEREATLALHPDHTGEVDLTTARESGQELFRRNRKPVFVTAGEQGILLFSEGGGEHIPAVPVAGEIDIVGAGDSVMAGIMASLCSGADPREAALVGNLVASITIQQIGTTGTASRAQVWKRFRSVDRA